MQPSIDCITDFARTDYKGPPLTDLVEIINYVKPTALLGLSTIRNAFTEEVVKAMAALNTRPIIFPLSNPISLSEVDFEDAVKWYVWALINFFGFAINKQIVNRTNGKVIFASGSPYKPFEREGTKYPLSKS